MRKAAKFLVIAPTLLLLTACAAPEPAGPSALELSTQGVCVKMNNQSYRSDVYFMFTDENVASWSTTLESEDKAAFRAVMKPIVDKSRTVAMQESASTFFGPAKVASFPELEQLQIQCAQLGINVQLPDKFSSYVD